MRPIGGHAVYIDARALLPHIPPLEYPGQALAVALYGEGGIRGCEIGTVMFGRHPDGTEAPAAMDLVRLAIPRRTYTQSHIDYVIEVCEHVASARPSCAACGSSRSRRTLRHFTARFDPLCRLEVDDQRNALEPVALAQPVLEEVRVVARDQPPVVHLDREPRRLRSNWAM